MPPSLRRSVAVLAGLLAALASPAAAPAGATEDEAQLRLLNQQDERLLRVGYRVAAANAELCPDKARLSGLLLHDARQYAPEYRSAAIRLFGFAGGPAVAAVVAESPAAKAGLLPGDRVVAIAGTPLPADLPPGNAPPSYDGIDAANSRVAAALALGPMQIEIERKGQRLRFTVAPTIGCASLVQLVPSGKLHAGADGDVVTISTALADFTETDDEMAVHVGHEMAHNALGHRQRLRVEGVPESGILTQFGKNAARIRATEREADYVGLYFLARAGYDPVAAVDFWTRYGRTHSLGIFAAPTHPGWKARVHLVQATMAEIAAQRARGEAITPGKVPAERR